MGGGGGLVSRDTYMVVEGGGQVMGGGYIRGGWGG
jgi:hypothetical protein